MSEIIYVVEQKARLFIATTNTKQAITTHHCRF
jgi:hypothetical protein